MRRIVAVLIIALIAAPALAEDHIQQYREEPKEKTATEKADDAKAERAYQRSLNNVPDQKPVDPWGAARDTGGAKAPAAPAVKHSSKAKTGTKAN